MNAPGPTGSAAQPRERPHGGGPLPRERYWPRLRRLTLVLLAAWFTVTFIAIFFARELDFRLFGWPFSFWLAAQGALIVYLAIVVVYAWLAGRLDRAHGVAEDD